MKKDLKRAKKMFFDYGCNHFYMMKEGVEEEYMKFGVGRQQEEEWFQEYISYWLNELVNGNIDAVHSLSHTGSQEILPRLIELLNKGDSYAKFWIAHTILRLSGKSINRNKKGRDTALQAFKELIEEKIKISRENKLKITPDIMWALKASTPEEYILNYSKRLYKDKKI